MTGERECHPACLLLPEMTDQEYRDLVDDIREHGQRRRIIVDEDGVILDGRHRDRACRELGIEPVTETFTGSEAGKIALVISENVRRRHLTADQRAAIGADLATMKQGTRTDLGPVGPMSAAEAAKVVGSSERSIKRAKARMRRDPEAHEKAKAGTLPRKQKARGTLGAKGEGYRKVEDRSGYTHREPTREPENVDRLEAVRIAVLEARQAGHSEDEVRAAVADVLAPPVTVVDATCWETNQSSHPGDQDGMP